MTDTSRERTLQEIMVEHRATIIDRIYDTAEELLLHPELPDRVATSAKLQMVVESLASELAAYEKTVVATSASNRGYEFRDLPPAESRRYKRARHAVNALLGMYTQDDAKAATT